MVMIIRTIVGLILLLGMPLLFMVIEQLKTGVLATSFYGQLTCVVLMFFALLIISKLSKSRTKKVNRNVIRFMNGSFQSSVWENCFLTSKLEKPIEE